MRVAQRFNAGSWDERLFGVPEGRLMFSAVPSGLICHEPHPSVKTVGYYRMSLRDKLVPENPNGIRLSRNHSVAGRFWAHWFG